MTINQQNALMSTMRLYEAETSIDEIAARHALDVKDVIDFSLNVNPFGPPAGAVMAATAALGQTHLYPDLRFSALRAALATRHGVNPESLFFGAGLDDVIKLIIHAWASDGDTVLIHLPTFPRYELEARLRGCKVVCVEGEVPERTNIDGMLAVLRDDPVAMTFVCSPNNPTGEKIPRESMVKLARAAGQGLVVIDEALLDPAQDGAVPLLAEHPNLVVLRTFSKYFGLAGARVGYAMAAPELVRAAEVGRPPFNLARASVEAARAVLGDAAFLDMCRTTFAEEREYFAAAIAAIPGVRIRGTNANMVLLEVDIKPGEAAERLAAKGIVVADATSFRGMERYRVLRVSLRGRADNEKLLAAIRGIFSEAK
jgi:histidinol-phosphate aminotransferase